CSSRRRHTSSKRDWSSDVCSSDLFLTAIDGTELTDQPLETILASAGQHGAGVRNQGGGYYNHNVFWECMAPNGGGQPGGSLAQAIDRDFGSFDEFKNQFTTAASTLFGSDRKSTRLNSSHVSIS